MPKVGENIKNKNGLKESKRLARQISQIIEDKKTLGEKIELLNEVREILHNSSPFVNEPVDLVIWEVSEAVQANDYNPNAVAPVEMRLLEHSIDKDGYTQPVVTWKVGEGREVVDGFHRTLVAKVSQSVRERLKGYVPVVQIRSDNQDRNERIASTIRHNRARGKHRIESMSDIVIELKKRNWADKRIGKELGMDEDEILRLCQITGLTEVFSDVDFCEGWDVGIFDDELETLEESDIQNSEESEGDSDLEGRIFHTYEKWECYPAGFYGDHPPEGMTVVDCERAFKKLLQDEERFRDALAVVINTWEMSCEHYLTNDRMNRIAWLGQAAMTVGLGIPSRFRGGFNLLSDKQKHKANSIALEYLNKWRETRELPKITLEEAGSKTEVNIY